MIKKNLTVMIILASIYMILKYLKQLRIDLKYKDKYLKKEDNQKEV
jgi:hypothetical protein